jgi:hypothetical protein
MTTTIVLTVFLHRIAPHHKHARKSAALIEDKNASGADP